MLEVGINKQALNPEIDVKMPSEQSSFINADYRLDRNMQANSKPKHWHTILEGGDQ
jgi:hypothetical protein